MHGRHAVVTGGGTGIGRGCALALAEAGATVTVVGRREAPLREVAEAARGLEGSVEPAPADVTDAAAVRDAVDAAEARAPVSMLVAAAGVNRPGPSRDLAPADWDAVLDVNVRGTWLPCQAVGRVLLDAGRAGSIVVVSSQMGSVGYPGRAAYCASKHAVNGLVRALGVEWAPAGIRVNAVAPTFVPTPLTARMLEDTAFTADVLARIPAGRLAEVDDVVASIGYLLSDAAGMVAGHVLAVDGGWTAW